MTSETNRQRAERYLSMATETALQAQRAGDRGVAEAYLQLAAAWLRMADEISARPANDEAAERAEPGGREEAKARV